MADSDRNNALKASYRKLLDDLKLTKALRPHFYDEHEALVAEFRQWVLDVSDLDSLPEIPPK